MTTEQKTRRCPACGEMMERKVMNETVSFPGSLAQL